MNGWICHLPAQTICFVKQGFVRRLPQKKRLPEQADIPRGNTETSGFSIDYHASEKETTDRKKFYQYLKNGKPGLQPGSPVSILLHITGYTR